MGHGHAEVDGAERALLEALMRQRQLGVATCDSDGILTMMSPALAASLGAVYEPTPEADWPKAYHLHDEHGRLLRPGADPLARALRGEQATDQVVTVRPPSEPVRWLLCSGFQLFDEGRQPIGAAVFVLDVTARATERRRLDELRDGLIQTVNHEVRTPLTTMRGQLELLEDLAPSLPEAVQWSLGAMGRAVDRLGEVAATISELAKQSQDAHDADDVEGR